jgi:hypothetical protein
MNVETHTHGYGFRDEAPPAIWQVMIAAALKGEEK